MRSPRRLTSLFAATAALVVAAVLGTAGAAAAHDELLSSDPADGAVVAALPAELVLTFSAPLLGDGAGNEVQVTDAAGATLSDGPAVVDGTTLTQPLTGDASGAVTVLWRAVSSDGHPISGQFAFTVTAPAPAPSETTTPTPSASAAESPAESATPSPTEAPAEDASATDPLPWIIGGVILLLVVGAVIYLLVVRPRRTGTGTGPDADR